MEIYVQANDYDAWRVITQGIEMPSIIEDRELVPKPEEDFDEKYTRKAQSNAKRMNTRKAQSNAKRMNLLYCVLSPAEFNRILGCDSAKEIWDILQVTHEGTDQVKEIRIGMLVCNTPLFQGVR